MNDTLARAIRVLRDLPDNMQESVGRVILDYAAAVDDDGVHA